MRQCVYSSSFARRPRAYPEIRFMVSCGRYPKERSRRTVRCPPPTRIASHLRSPDRARRRPRSKAHRHAVLLETRWTRHEYPSPPLPTATVLTCPIAALKFLSPAADPPVPWQRVVSSAGKISSRGPGTDGAARQSEALQAEEVEVHVGRTNELLVDLATYGWFPAPGTISLTAP